MFGRIFIVINAKNFSEHDAKIFHLKILTVTEKSLKNRSEFTQLWHQRPCSLKVKIHLFVQI